MAHSHTPGRRSVALRSHASDTASADTRLRASQASASHRARCVSTCASSWHTRYTKATFCDATSRGTLPCSSASEASILN
eukprot:1137774-Prymnesium_polylepis.1